MPRRGGSVDQSGWTLVCNRDRRLDMGLGLVAKCTEAAGVRFVVLEIQYDMSLELAEILQLRL